MRENSFLKSKNVRHLYILSFFLLFFACQKEIGHKESANEIPENYKKTFKNWLQKNISAEQYASLDFSKIQIAKDQNESFIEIGFLNKSFSSDFLLLKTDFYGNGTNGRIVHLEKDNSTPSQFNGKIIIEDLQANELVNSQISNGYIVVFHKEMQGTVSVNSLATPDVVPAPAVQTLPEVIVVGYLNPYPTGSSMLFTDYMSFQSMLGNPNGGSPVASGSYSPVPGGSGGAGTTLPLVLPITVESSFSAPGINVKTYLDCFASIADAGSQCTISIFCDLPVNNDPAIFFNWYTGATGHVFLQLTKSNSGSSISQTLGFTAQKALQAIGASNPVASKMVDNGGHKYNATLKMNITPDQLNTAIGKIELLSNLQYSITNFNCVDFALQVMNCIRGTSPLVVPKYQIPGQPMSNSNTPEGLYMLLESMQAQNTPDAKNILMDVVQYAPKSSGPCYPNY